MTTVNAYLNFNGSCEEAFNFYKSVFGVEFHYLRNTFWGDYFGMFTDKFGINWMVSFPTAQQ